MAGYTPTIMDSIDLADGTRMVFAEWDGADPPFVAAHGLTSSHTNIAAVASELDGGIRVVAPDLRGRGLSGKPPAGSYGMDQHADDVLALMDSLGIERAIVGGHSMGAYVAATLAARAPDRVLGLVLIDGGVIYVPPEMEAMMASLDPDTLLETAIGPVMERMRRTFASVDEYREFWRAMPYFAEWNEVVERYVLSDLGRRGSGYASKCSEAAAVEDWRDLLTNPAHKDRYSSITCPILCISGTVGMTGSDAPVLGPAHIEHLRTMAADVEAVTVEGASHHTVTLSPEGARATAEALRKFVERVRG